jgi:hypothetical protein
LASLAEVFAEELVAAAVSAVEAAGPQAAAMVAEATVAVLGRQGLEATC